jgi:predicted ABC-type sugar transport system permease subunit
VEERDAIAAVVVGGTPQSVGVGSYRPRIQEFINGTIILAVSVNRLWPLIRLGAFG